MPERLRIAVTGLAATYPFGGVFWDYFQYPLGLHRLGHDVLYIEDTGQWCYDPQAMTFVEDGTRNASLLARNIGSETPELALRWFFRDAGDRCFGRTAESVRTFCREADLFVNLSATCWMRDDYFAARRVAFIDSDPVYTQASFPRRLDGSMSPREAERVERMLRHDVFFTFAENIGRPDCAVPSDPVHWIPTRQPIVIECFSPHRIPLPARRRILTTVGSWEPAQRGPVLGGVEYRGKSAEFERFLDLPARSPLPLELAMGGPCPRERLRDHGWQMVDPDAVSATPASYRTYLASSLAEWSVAKNAYVASRSGWFSCRSACYLALGVPVIVQDTGFSRFLPTGRGVLAFTTIDEAIAAIDSLLADPQGHAEAAREIARECFAHDRVLGELVGKAMADIEKHSPTPPTSQ